MKNVLMYLRSTKDMLLIFGGEFRVLGYTKIDDRKFILAYIFLCHSGMVYWMSSKQPIIENSIMEVEFIAISKCANVVY